MVHRSYYEVEETSNRVYEMWQTTICLRLNIGISWGQRPAMKMTPNNNNLEVEETLEGTISCKAKPDIWET